MAELKCDQLKAWGPTTLPRPSRSVEVTSNRFAVRVNHYKPVIGWPVEIGADDQCVLIVPCRVDPSARTSSRRRPGPTRWIAAVPQCSQRRLPRSYSGGHTMEYTRPNASAPAVPATFRRQLRPGRTSHADHQCLINGPRSPDPQARNPSSKRRRRTFSALKIVVSVPPVCIRGAGLCLTAVRSG